VRSLMKQICGAVAHLHAARVCHRDIKPENFAIREQEEGIEVKLGGFQVARRQALDQLCTSSCGTMPFAAPEAIIEARYDGMAADLWSVGVVFIEVCCGLRLVEHLMTQRYGQVLHEVSRREVEGFKDAYRKLREAFAEDGMIHRVADEAVPELQHSHPWLVPLLAGLLHTWPSERPAAVSLQSAVP